MSLVLDMQAHTVAAGALCAAHTTALHTHVHALSHSASLAVCAIIHQLPLLHLELNITQRQQQRSHSV